MTERVQVGSLQVAKVLYDFVVEEALPGTGVDAETFWAGADKVITELAPKNRDLLAKRDDLQAQIDQWHRDHAGQVRDQLHRHPVQPGWRAGPCLHRRQRAGQPWRH